VATPQPCLRAELLLAIADGGRNGWGILKFLTQRRKDAMMIKLRLYVFVSLRGSLQNVVGEMDTTFLAFCISPFSALKVKGKNAGIITVVWWL
jgi:hypothetical protein